MPNTERRAGIEARARESERLIALAGQQLESLRATIAKYGGPDRIKTAG